MSHYFSNNPQLKENRRDIHFRFLDIVVPMVTDDGVFSKEGLDIGTESLLKVLVTQDLGSRIFDLGCGIGSIGVILSKTFHNITVDGVDVNERAVSCAKENYRRHDVMGTLSVNDGVNGQYDTIVSNPPIRVGKEKLYELFDEIYNALSKNGQFFFVIRKSHGAKSAQKKCEDLFGLCELLKKDKGFYIYKAVKI